MFGYVRDDRQIKDKKWQRIKFQNLAQRQQTIQI